MPRPKSAPTYCVHRRSNRAYSTVDGRQVPLGKAGSPESREAFDRLLSRYYANGRKLPPEPPMGAAPLPVGPTVAVLLEGFWTYAQVYYTEPVFGPDGNALTNDDGTPKTQPSPQQVHYRQCIKLLNRNYGGMQTADFGCPQLEALRDIVMMPHTDPVTGRTRPGWCRNHVNRQMNRIRLIFGWGVTKHLVPAVVHTELKLLPALRAGKSRARETAPVQPVAEQRALAIVPFVSRQVGAMIKLQVITGMRSTELCIMRPCDLDRTSKPWVYRPAFHKTAHHGIPREIMLNAEARQIIEPYLDRDPAAYCFSPAEAEKERRDELKDPSPHATRRRAHRARRRKTKQPFGARYDRRSYYQAIRYGCELAFNMPREWRWSPADQTKYGDTPQQVKEKAERRQQKAELRRKWYEQNAWHPHQARHRAATDLRSTAGMDVAKIQLGHTTEKMTRRYAQADFDKAKQAIEHAA